MPGGDGDDASTNATGEWTVVTSGSRHGKRRGGRGGSHPGGLQQREQQQRSKALPAWHQSGLRAGYSEEETEREASRLRAALAERKAAMRASSFYRRLEAEIRRRLQPGHDEGAAGDDSGGGSGGERVAALVCYGLGSVQSTTCNALWQLACLLLLRDAFLPLPVSGLDAQAGAEGEKEDGAAQAEAEVFDPIFDEVDRRLLRSVGLAAPAHNDAGKRRLAAPLPLPGGAGGGDREKERTLFFMPHCPRRLYSNVLWANWAPGALSRVVVAGNSLASYVDRTLPSEQGKDSTDCLAPLLPLARESPIKWTAPPKKRSDGEKGENAVEEDAGRAWEAGAPAAFMDLSVFDFPLVPPASDTNFWETRRPKEHTGPITDG